MQFPILLDRSRPDSLTDQLAEQFRGAIRHQRIPPGHPVALVPPPVGTIGHFAEYRRPGL